MISSVLPLSQSTSTNNTCSHLDFPTNWFNLCQRFYLPFYVEYVTYPLPLFHPVDSSLAAVDFLNIGIAFLEPSVNIFVTTNTFISRACIVIYYGFRSIFLKFRIKLCGYHPFPSKNFLTRSSSHLLFHHRAISGFNYV